MATLTRFKTLKSLKQSSETKSKRTVSESTLRMTEIEKFMLLLQKEKPQKAKTTKK